MTIPHAFRRSADAQHTALRNHVVGVQEKQSAYFADLYQRAAAAQSQLQAIYERYLQEVRAASAGDDAIQRASTAYRNLQRDSLKVYAEYAEASQTSFSAMTEALGALSAETRNAMIDSWIEYLGEFRKAGTSRSTDSTSSRE